MPGQLFCFRRTVPPSHEGRRKRHGSQKFGSKSITARLQHRQIMGEGGNCLAAGMPGLPNPAGDPVPQAEAQEPTGSLPENLR